MVVFKALKNKDWISTLHNNDVDVAAALKASTDVIDTPQTSATTIYDTTEDTFVTQDTGRPVVIKKGDTFFQIMRLKNWNNAIKTALKYQMYGALVFPNRQSNADATYRVLIPMQPRNQKPKADGFLVNGATILRDYPDSQGILPSHKSSQRTSNTKNAGVQIPQAGNATQKGAHKLRGKEKKSTTTKPGAKNNQPPKKPNTSAELQSITDGVKLFEQQHAYLMGPTLLAYGTKCRPALAIIGLSLCGDVDKAARIYDSLRGSIDLSMVIRLLEACLKQTPGFTLSQFLDTAPVNLWPQQELLSELQLHANAPFYSTLLLNQIKKELGANRYERYQNIIVLIVNSCLTGNIQFAKSAYTQTSNSLAHPTLLHILGTIHQYRPDATLSNMLDTAPANLWPRQELLDALPTCVRKPFYKTLLLNQIKQAYQDGTYKKVTLERRELPAASRSKKRWRHFVVFNDQDLTEIIESSQLNYTATRELKIDINRLAGAYGCYRFLFKGSGFATKAIFKSIIQDGKKEIRKPINYTYTIETEPLKWRRAWRHEYLPILKKIIGDEETILKASVQRGIWPADQVMDPRLFADFLSSKTATMPYRLRPWLLHAKAPSCPAKDLAETVRALVKNTMASIRTGEQRHYRFAACISAVPLLWALKDILKLEKFQQVMQILQRSDSDIVDIFKQCEQSTVDGRPLKYPIGIVFTDAHTIRADAKNFFTNALKYRENPTKYFNQTSNLRPVIILQRDLDVDDYNGAFAYWDFYNSLVQIYPTLVPLYLEWDELPALKKACNHANGTYSIFLEFASHSAGGNFGPVTPSQLMQLPCRNILGPDGASIISACEAGAVSDDPKQNETATQRQANAIVKSKPLDNAAEAVTKITQKTAFAMAVSGTVEQYRFHPNGEPISAKGSPLLRYEVQK